MLTSQRSRRILLDVMETKTNKQQMDNDSRDETRVILSRASELVRSGDVKAARTLIKKALPKARPDDRVRLLALDRSLRMDTVAKVAFVITAIALAIVAYVSLLH